MRVMLAPMEGVLDGFVRELLTAINPYDLCTTEFVRVVNTRLPSKTFLRLCPELARGGFTQAGTPVRVQLLGQSPEWMAENAERAAQLGSQGIDINCGCPAKKVVGSDGGASLLRDPERIYRITQAVKQALPTHVPLSVKVRLGWDSAQARFEIADAVAQGGADEIVVHGRTKEDGYRAECINWAAIGEIKQRLTIPVIANGEIWTPEDAKRCIAITQCDGLMLGRGALNLPNLGAMIKMGADKLAWTEVYQLLSRYMLTDNPFDSGYYHSARLKQWLSYLRKTYPEAQALFSDIRAMKSAEELRNYFAYPRLA